MPRARHRLHEPLEVYWSLWICETRMEPWAEKRSWGGRPRVGLPRRKKHRHPGSAPQDNPTISPLSSMSMRSAAGADERPGMVRMSPQMG
jgi:hypothetical protein